MVPLLLACLWIVIACTIAMFPSKRHHWPAAYVLMTVGAPILIWLWISEGVLMAFAFAAAGVSILRWPVRYLWRWMRRQIASRRAQ